MAEKIRYDYRKGNRGGNSLSDHGDNVLYSPKRIYFGRIQADGKFVVYRGAGPEDQHDALWSTNNYKNPPAGSLGVSLMFMVTAFRGNPIFLEVVAPNRDNRFYDLWKSPSFDVGDSGGAEAVVEDDGNFRIYKLVDGGRPPKNAMLWQSGVTDPLVDCEVTKIDYDIKAAEILNARSLEVASQTLENPSDREASSSIAGSKTVSATSSWSDSLAIKAGIKTSYKAGVPAVSEAGVEVSLDIENTYTWGGSDSTAVTFSWDAPITAGPWENAHVSVSVTESTIRVPFTLTGELVFESGRRLSGRTIHGIYEGKNSRHVRVIVTREKIKHPAAAAAAANEQPEVIPVMMEYPVTVNYTYDQ